MERAAWQQQVDAARGSIYTATVNGHRTSEGRLWAVNEVPRVNDEFANIDTRMLVHSVTFQLGNEEGGLTMVACVARNAYSLDLDEPVEVVKESGGYALAPA